MKPSTRQRAKQLRLTLEADESRVWETLESHHQQQVVERLISLWMQCVRTSLEAQPDTNASARHES
jgi:hypothetical protein